MSIVIIVAGAIFLIYAVGSAYMAIVTRYVCLQDRLDRIEAWLKKTENRCEHIERHLGIRNEVEGS